MTRKLQSPMTTEPPISPPSRGLRLLRGARAVIPGLALCSIATVIALLLHQFAPRLSPLLIAIVLGVVAANAVSIPLYFRPGLQFSSKKLLRVGVALLGLQLLIGDILGLGWGTVVGVIAIVGLGIVGTSYIGGMLGLSFAQRILIACGFSVCGAAAVAAVDGVVEAKEEEVVTAVALVVIFGTLMIPLIPLLAGTFGLSDTQAGMWAGGSIHEVAQVVAAGGAISGTALGVAVVVKLARVLMLAPVMAILSVRQRRIAGTGHGQKRPPIIPLFVASFIVLVAVRSTGTVPDSVLSFTQSVQTALLTAAMFALGTGVHWTTIKSVGVRPFVLASISTLLVASTALLAVVLFG